MIEEYHTHSETLIEENVHLLAKVYEKIAGIHKKAQRQEEALDFYIKALAVGDEVYPKNSIFVVKMHCFIGEILSRSENTF